MRIVHLSYAVVKEYDNSNAWLQRINFFVLLLERMSFHHELHSIHCINYTGKLKRGAVQYHFFQRKDGRFSAASEVNKYVVGLNPDIVIIHGLHFPWQLLSLIRMIPGDVTLIIQHHAEKPLMHDKAMLQRILDRRIAAYFFTSIDQVKPWVEQKLIKGMDRVFEIMEVPSVFHPVDRALAKSTTNVKDGSCYLWVGRFDDNKDPITLVKAFSDFAGNHHDVFLYIVFRGGNLLREVERLLKENGLSRERIVLVGEVSHVNLLYWFNSVDFIISTSHYEGSGVAIAEGMSCGCIPILTDIASFDKMTNHRSFGAVFERGNRESLVEALNRSVAMDLAIEREKVLSYYKSYLSPDAISAAMISVCEKMRANPDTRD